MSHNSDAPTHHVAYSDPNGFPMAEGKTLHMDVRLLIVETRHLQ